jgi:VWFA-related protein
MKLPRSAILAAFMASAVFSSNAQVPTFTAMTEEVRIDALVTDQRKPVIGLQSTDFEVLDNGVKQKVEYVSFENTPISVTMAMDLSNSVTGDLLDHLKSAGDLLLKGLKKDERAALITFDHAVKLRSPLTSDIDLIKEGLDGMQSLSFGETSLIDASYAALILAESVSERPLAVIFSDGLDTLSLLPEDEVLESAKQTHAVVYAVSIGQLPAAFLKDLTRHTGGSLFAIESSNDLGNVFARILEEFRKRYLICYIPQSVPNSGWHSVKVRVKQHNYKTVHRMGYMQKPANKSR